MERINKNKINSDKIKLNTKKCVQFRRLEYLDVHFLLSTVQYAHREIKGNKGCTYLRMLRRGKAQGTIQVPTYPKYLWLHHRTDKSNK